jgi:hypothetical protein
LEFYFIRVAGTVHASVIIIIIGSTALGVPGLLEEFCPFISVEGGLLPVFDTSIHVS